MPLRKSRAIEADGGAWASLFKAELTRRETAWPANAVTLEQVRKMRKNAGLSSSDSMTRKFLAVEIKNGRVKLLRGYKFMNGKLRNDCRYVLAK